jgi:hypothetical protein
MHRSKKYITANLNKSIVNVDYLEEGQMFIVDDEELTPLEVTKLALYYSLNLEENLCNSLENT